MSLAQASTPASLMVNFMCIWLGKVMPSYLVKLDVSVRVFLGERSIWIETGIKIPFTNVDDTIWSIECQNRQKGKFSLLAWDTHLLLLDTGAPACQVLDLDWIMLSTVLVLELANGTSWDVLISMWAKSCNKSVIYYVVHILYINIVLHSNWFPHSQSQNC